MTTTLNSAIARVRAVDGRVVGTGFLVGQRHALTCAHVVAQALGVPEGAVETPQGEVLLDFPLVAPEQRLSAQVACWQPARPDGSGDVAGLKLLGNAPAGASPVRLVKADEPWGHTFRASGFPKGYENGAWASGRILGREAQEQPISTTSVGHKRKKPAFSGGSIPMVPRDRVELSTP